MVQELAVLINSVSNLQYIDDPFYVDKKYKYELRDFYNNIANTAKNYFEGSEVKRVYFGNEFCEYLLPTVMELEKAINYAFERDKKFTFITPIVTDYGIKRLKELFDYLYSNHKDVEIVINDFGVLDLVLESFSDFVCIAGRMIDKTFNDPRLSQNDYKKGFSENGLKYIQRPSITSIYYQNFLKENKINRAEFDLLPQGFDIRDEELDSFSLSVYMPFGYVTTGRQCMMKMLSEEDESKFVIDRVCGRNCSKYIQIMHKHQGAFPGDSEEILSFDIDLFRKGNTVFSCNMNPDTVKSLKSVDRIIYQPVL